jgi:hypothetical protein
MALAASGDGCGVPLPKVEITGNPLVEQDPRQFEYVAVLPACVAMPTSTTFGTRRTCRCAGL